VTGRRPTLAFAGTPDFAASVLAGLCRDRQRDFAAIVTQPDRPSGRGRRTLPGPVKRLAQRLELPVLQPADPTALAAVLRELRPDLLIVVAYGLILSPAALDLPRHGCINLHASLLPRWRGAAPVQRAILAGDTQSGVTVMQMDAGLDTGDILAQRTCPIDPHDTTLTLLQRMAPLGIDCLGKVLGAIGTGELVRTPQDDAAASLAPKIQKSEAQVDWSAPATQIARMVRAFIPEPLARARIAGQEFLLWETETLDDSAPCRPGEVLSHTPAGIEIGTGHGRLRLLRFQLPGRTPVSARDFYNARPDWHRHCA
jgi:methionyl-tRNA formyltransferase